MTHHIYSISGIRQAGFSLVELMISITLGLLILAGLTSVFVNSNRARNEIEKAGQQIENGRYALQVMTDDLRNAGYLAEFDPRVLATPTTKPDACATAVALLQAAVPLHVQAYDRGLSAPSCLTDVKSGSDILVVRRVSTCAAGVANCDAVTAGAPYFQASLCNPAAGGTELASTATDYSTSFYALDTDTANLTRHKRDCTTVAEMHRYLTHIYYIANNDVSGDGIPTLKRAELGAGGFTIVPIAEGVEKLQIEYGVDTTGLAANPTVCDGNPDTFTADPDSLAAPTCSVKTGAVVMDNWRNVVALQIYLLARNTKLTDGYTDSKMYTLGLKADGSANNFGPYNDGYKRHAFQSMVRLNNPSSRSATP